MNFCALRPCFIDHLFLLLTFVKFHAEIFFQILPFFIHCCLCCGNYHGLKHRNKFVHQIVMLQRDSSIRILVDSLSSEIHANLDLKSSVLLCFFFLLFLQGIAGATGVSNFLTSILDGLFAFLVLTIK